MTSRSSERSDHNRTPELHAVPDLDCLPDIDIGQINVLYQGRAVQGTGPEVLARYRENLGIVATTECKPEET